MPPVTIEYAKAKTESREICSLFYAAGRSVPDRNDPAARTLQLKNLQLRKFAAAAQLQLIKLDNTKNLTVDARPS